MKLSLNWVNEILDLGEISSQKLNFISQRLVDGGFEVEEIYETKQSIILDISAPANRAESLSVCGMIKELSLLLNKPYKPLTNDLTLFTLDKNKENNPTLKDKRNGNKNFTAFGVTIIENLENIKTPEWIKTRLEDVDIIPTDTILDYQNYILLETGYPFEFYDLQKIKEEITSDEFSLRVVETNEKDISFEASDNKFYTLNPSTLVVKANNTIIGIAGIVPAKKVECTKKTKSILIESSVFTSSMIRKQSRLTGCRTERSIRYEKDIQNYQLITAHDRLVKLISSNCPNAKSYPLTRIVQTINPDFIIELTYKKFIEIVNLLDSRYYPLKDNLDPNLISEYLILLNYNYTYNEKNKSWIVKIPGHHKKQITRPVHLVQEISRVHGFDKFPALIPSTISSGKNDKTHNLKLILSSYFLDLGLNEFINYSANANKNNYTDTFSLINPLNKEQSKLQRSLISNILDCITENLKNTNYYIEGFEFGHTFSLLSDIPRTSETEYVSGVFTPKRIKNDWELNDQNEIWIRTKGKFQQLFEQLNVKVTWSNINSTKYNEILNPNIMSSLKTESGELLGVIGQLHPFYSKYFSEYTNLFLFEFNLDIIKTNIEQTKLLTSYEYVKYPAIMINISFKHYKPLNCDILKELILVNGTRFLTQVSVYNIIIKKTTNEENYNYVFTLTFQSNENTLSKNEIIPIVENIEEKINIYIENISDNSII